MSDMFEAPAAFVIFADDIRTEQTGKHTIVGAYGGHLIIHGPKPAMLGQLAAWCTYTEPRDFSEEAVRLVITVVSSGEEMFNEVVVPAGPRPIVYSADVEDQESRLNVTYIRRFGQLLVKDDEIIRVRWYCGDRKVHGGGLRLTFADPSAE